MPPAKLTGPRITALYRELETSGRKDHRASEPLAPRTVRYVHTILRAALQAAVEADLLPRNPADRAVPTVKQARVPEMQVWTPAQLRTFLTWAAGDEHQPVWLWLAHTGTRRGEALALRWRDIDLDAARPASGGRSAPCE